MPDIIMDEPKKSFFDQAVEAQKLRKKRSRLEAEQANVERRGRLADLALGAIGVAEDVAKELTLPKFAGEAMQHVETAGEMLNTTGRAARGFAVDLMQGNVLPNRGRVLPDLQNTFSGLDSQGDLPAEEGAPLLQKGLADAAEMGPTMVAGMLMGGGPAAFAALEVVKSLARTKNDPLWNRVFQATKGAATGAIVPAAARVGERAGAEVAARMGVGSEMGRKVTESLGSQAAAQVAVEGGNVPDYMGMPKEDVFQNLARNILGNVAYVGLEAPKYMPGKESLTRQIYGDEPRVEQPNPTLIDEIARSGFEANRGIEGGRLPETPIGKGSAVLGGKGEGKTGVGEVERPSVPGERRPVAVVAKGEMDFGLEGMPKFQFYDLQEEIPGHPKGSTVSQKTLEDAGYAVPEGIAQDAPEVMSQKIEALQKLFPQSKGLQTKAALQNNQQAGFLNIPWPKGKPPVSGGPINAKDWLFDFDPKADANLKFSQKFASENVPVLAELLGGKGAWVDRRPRLMNPEDQAIATWYAERHGVGPGVASSVGAYLGGEVNAAFKADKNGDLNVQVRPESKASKKISDVFEALQAESNDYILTPEQQNAYQRLIRPIMTRMAQLKDQYKLVDVSGPYFMRGSPVGPDGRFQGFMRKKVGAKQGSQRERMFDTEAEGWTAGYKYDTDVEARMVNGIQEMYRAISDKRLANDPSLGGQTPKQKLQELAIAYPNKAPQQLRKMLKSLMSKNMVHTPAFQGKIFSADVADTIKREFAAEESRVRRLAVGVNSALKALKLGYDLGVGQIQLLPTLYNRPDIWAKAQGHSMMALVSKNGFTEYVRRPENQTAIQELAKHGSSVGRLEEYMMGSQGGSAYNRALREIPVVGEIASGVTQAFGRQFQTALDVAKIELWKAWRDVTPQDQQYKVVQAIESTLLSGRMESAMVPANRALLERVMLLAPSYYRGSLNFVAALKESGVSGQVARRAMARFAAGGVATYVAAAYLAGMDEDEMLKRLNPTRADFMMIPVQTEQGDELNVGFGGIYRSYLRLMGNTTKYLSDQARTKKRTGSFEAPAFSSKENPLVAWYRGHAGPLPAGVWDAASGEDFLGKKTDVKTLAKSTLPLATKAESKTDLALQSFGLSTLPGRAPSAEEVAKKLFPGREYESLSMKERAEANKQARAGRKVEGLEEAGMAAQRAMEYQFENREQLSAALKPESKTFLEENGILVPAFKLSASVGGKMRGLPRFATRPKTEVKLTEDEQDEMFRLMVEEYETAIDSLKKVNISAFGEKQKARRVEREFSRAKDRAEKRFKNSAVQNLDTTKKAEQPSIILDE